ncbi:hypothetical protein [Stenotrophomonas maltophilia]|uniref:hypothetical protein n=1 Tax=Stenotrophomonas maltophilia TaxID=40324 RepID=UPI00209AF96C|nr:hypothetical protein [Stenotrophomonas maltophilia]MCO7494753.1 hypothetical protein [Stenotrophomonas maltophilia]
MDVEQRAQAVFGLSWADYWMERGQPDIAHDFDAFSRAEAWALQHFHSSLTPPEGHVVVTRNEAGKAVAVTRQDDEGRILSVIAEFGPPTGYVLVPVEPTPGLLMSMAIRRDHALGCPGYYDLDMFTAGGHVGHQRILEAVISEARKQHEEVVGAGFYSPDKEASYAAMLAARPEVK